MWRAAPKARCSRSETDIYLADTLGETGLIYRLGALAFVGRSLTAKGGQNPIEAAKLGCAILHGPHVGAFREVYAALDAARGRARRERIAATLTEAVARLLGGRASPAPDGAQRCRGRGRAKRRDSARACRRSQPYLARRDMIGWRTPDFWWRSPPTLAARLLRPARRDLWRADRNAACAVAA